MGEKDYKLIKLGRENYVVWKWQFKNVLKAKGLQKVLLEGAVEEKRERQALALLGSSSSD